MRRRLDSPRLSPGVGSSVTQEREALAGQGEQLQTAADAAQRALDTERSKRQALAEEMYQRERIVQVRASLRW